MEKTIWMDEPEDRDFVSALDYLELLLDEAKVQNIIKSLKKSDTIEKKAKDILRASGLPLLPEDNIHVKKDIKKVRKWEKLSPILLVKNNEKLIVADGYHRVCAIYYLSEDLSIPCRLV